MNPRRKDGTSVVAEINVAKNGLSLILRIFRINA